ncbi:succinate dehydrogenase cytochrome b560 subunit, mitochondrial-like [Clavelina lepadiformis]|uniref:succinate dehydrogenase cytochrome b560 subunit, mitochondrial-like n=1 Tax=Clavelina lepadiformis TaxID=159417 RepID=UPI00404270F7
MSLLSRVLSKQHLVLSNRCRPELFAAIFSANKSSGSAQKQMDDFWAKNKSVNRPMSPHLTIYKPQLTSMLSITHRATGIALAALTSGFAFSTLLPGTAVAPILAFAESLHSSWLGSGFLLDLKFIVAWPLIFHSINGLRHLMWDRASGLKIAEVYQSGWFVLALSTLLAVIFILPWNKINQK